MNDQDTKRLLHECIDEIEHLRLINNELAPKAHAYDTLCQVLGLLPKQGQGFAPDIVGKIERVIEKIDANSPGDADDLSDTDAVAKVNIG